MDDKFSVSDIKKMYIDMNLSVREICNTLGCSNNALYKILRENNLKKTKEQIAEAKRNGLLQKYGVTNASQIPGSREKAKSTYLEKTGYDSPAHNPDSIAKKEATCIYRYGTKNPILSEEIRNKRAQTCIDKYGVENPLMLDDMQAKCRETYYARTGYYNPSNNPEVVNKRKSTNLERYNAPNFNQREFSERTKNILFSRENFEEYLKTCKYKNTTFICEDLGVAPSTIVKTLTKYDLWALIDKGSLGETEIRDFVRSLGFSTEHSKMIIPPKELDIYIKEKHIAIEFNGNYWHSDIILPDKKYHFNKSRACADKGIRLIHIYEYEWGDPVKREIIKSMLKISLGVVDSKIYARQCEVKKITNKEAKPFNELNHLQGHKNAQVTYGLYYNDTLVQLMSFSYNKKKDWWEIERGCPGSNNIVIGGVSRLFKHFIAEYNPRAVFSYCDYNKFDGKGYEAIGMKFIGYTGPDMKWLINNKIVNRLPSKHTELSQIADAKIWGAGSKKYLWENKSSKQK